MATPNARRPRKRAVSRLPPRVRDADAIADAIVTLLAVAEDASHGRSTASADAFAAEVVAALERYEETVYAERYAVLASEARDAVRGVFARVLANDRAARAGQARRWTATEREAAVADAFAGTALRLEPADVAHFACDAATIDAYARRGAGAKVTDRGPQVAANAAVAERLGPILDRYFAAHRTAGGAVGYAVGRAPTGRSPKPGEMSPSFVRDQAREGRRALAFACPADPEAHRALVRRGLEILLGPFHEGHTLGDALAELDSPEP